VTERIGAGGSGPVRLAQQDAEDAAAAATVPAPGPAPGTLAFLLAQPSPLDRLVSGAGQLARFAAADPTPVAAPGMTIRRNEILPDIAPRYAIGAAVAQLQPAEPMLRAAAWLETEVSLAARVEAPERALGESGSALPPAACVEPTARAVHGQPSIDLAMRDGEGQG
jgi:hypothetical protein